MGSDNSKSKNTEHSLPPSRRRRRNDNDQNSLSSCTRTGKPCTLWYRHSGEPEIVRMPYIPECKSVEDEREIITDVGVHHITHMYIQNGVIPTLDIVAPRLTHLQVRGLTNQSDLQILSSFTQLKVLHLSDNNFGEGLPAVLSDMCGLETLSLCNCQLRDLPQSLSSLTQLKALSLSDNDFGDGLPAVLSDMCSLERLWLWDCGLRDLPQSLSSLTQLKELELGENNFGEGLPAVLSNMCSLEDLWLYRCKLRDLPQSLSSLTELKELNLSVNNFGTGLPAVLSNMCSLEKLELDKCQLRVLPQSLSSLTELKELYLHNNNFGEGLPAVLSNLCSLELLRLHNCQLRDLPQSLSSLSQLKVLALDHNDFGEGLPAVLFNMCGLEILWLCGCELIDLPQSLSSLTELEQLYLSENNFGEGLPAVLSNMCSLEILWLNNCQLRDLPQRLACETQLQELDLQENDFEQLPSVIYNMCNLQKLDLSSNYGLVRINKEISQLSNLTDLDCDDCASLQFPPYGVCEQGLSAIKKYFADLETEKGVELLEVPVAVVGMLLSGKSSIIKSLQAGERKLTYRKEGSPLDETTRVFQLEDLSLKESRVRFIDYGGHQVYHMAYQLVTNERCLPLVVVNLKEFHDLSVSTGPKEATRKLCIDWLSHLYLACPRLGPPLLALTHTDMLAEEEVKKCRDELLSMSEAIRDEMLKEDRLCSGALTNNSSRILHLANRQLPLFDPDDIFEFSNDLDEKMNIEHLCNNLDNRCKSFSLEIPRLWEKVEKFVGEHKEKAYVNLSEVMKEFPADDPITILRYMHNTGKVLWFERIEGLSSYIFHDIPAITDMISLLLNHSSDELWSERVNTFIPFAYKQRTVGSKRYSSLVEQFTTSGMIDQVLLDHLLESDSRFPVAIAKELLRSFHILHGPLDDGNGSTYILPYFARTAMDDSWQAEGPVPLRMDIVFGGLSLPEYVYQLMTVVVLNRTRSVLANVKVKKNGVTISHGECSTHFIHDYSERKVTLQVSSTVSQLSLSWKHLIKTVNDILDLLSRVWKASHAEILVYCAHCLISRTSDPARDAEPNWFHAIAQDYNLNKIRTVTTISPLEKVKCGSEDQKPTVPKPLRYPCEQLSADDIQTLEKHISAIEQSCPPQLAGSSREAEGSSTPSNDTQAVDGYISDVEAEGYCDISTRANIEISLRLQKVKDEGIKQLYRDSEKVYLMTSKVRGRALIINIKAYSPTTLTREGSDVDYDNLSNMFKELDFVIAKSQQELSDLTVEEIYKEIEEETRREEHEKLGMFVLVIMSHGRRGGILLDCNSQPVDLVNIQDLLSPGNFPAMKGKPKVLIVQACSGARQDYGDSKDLLVKLSSASASSQSVPGASDPTSQSASNTSDPSSQSAAGASDPSSQSTTPTDEPLTFVRAPRGPIPTPPPPDVLNVDDFFIMKASCESYLATRTPSHGSWFIRVLVATFYKHSNHRDIESLFKIIQARVRQVSLAPANVQRYGYNGGNVPTAISTFTKHRKLYLFPGYHPR